MEATEKKSGRGGMIILVVIACVLAIVAVYQQVTLNKKSQEIATLTEGKLLAETQRDSLSTDLNTYTETVNAVTERLRVLRESQVSIARLIQATDQVTPKDQMLGDITDIEQQLQKDRQEITDLQLKLKKSGIRLASLEKMITGLRKQVADNQTLIDNLRADIAKKDETIRVTSSQLSDTRNELSTTKTTLTGTTRDLNTTRQELTAERNTAWYVIGTKGELVEKNILKSTGFLIFNKSLTLAPAIVENNFTAIDITTQQEFTLPTIAKNVKILPARAADSYVIEDHENSSTLRVVDKDAFWKIQYMAVVVKG